MSCIITHYLHNYIWPPGINLCVITSSSRAADYSIVCAQFVSTTVIIEQIAQYTRTSITILNKTENDLLENDINIDATKSNINFRFYDRTR